MAELGAMPFISSEELEENFGSQRTEQLARDSEYNFLKSVTDIAYEAAWSREVKAIFISGPTSSGKTTFADRLGSAIHLYGRPTRRISLDDYYFSGDYEFDEQGRPDMESISTIDVELLTAHLAALLRGEEVSVPSYDFTTRTRTYLPENQYSLANNAILVVEGLHGLSAQVLGRLPREQTMGVFICPWATLVGDRKLLVPEQIRQLRRICRDFLHRGTGPLATLDYWPVISATEEVTFEEYVSRADYFVNSVIKYEFFVVGPLAAGYLKQDLARLESGEILTSPLTRTGEFADLDAAVAKARYLIYVSERMPQLDTDVVPPMSILNEFIH